MTGLATICPARLDCGALLGRLFENLRIHLTTTCHVPLVDVGCTAHRKQPHSRVLSCSHTIYCHSPKRNFSLQINRLWRTLTTRCSKVAIRGYLHERCTTTLDACRRKERRYRSVFTYKRDSRVLVVTTNIDNSARYPPQAPTIQQRGAILNPFSVP